MVLEYIADVSSNILAHYFKTSVTDCSSTSPSIKFYLSYVGRILDCFLTNNCPINYLCVAPGGVDYTFSAGAAYLFQLVFFLNEWLYGL